MLADGRDNVITREEVAAQGQNLVYAPTLSSSPPLLLNLTRQSPVLFQSDFGRRIAGSETTATTLSAVTYYLLKNPSAQARFVSEIRTHFSTYDEISSNRVGALPYFHAVINEAMRLYPPVPFGPPRLSPGAWVDGAWVPKGVRNQPPWKHASRRGMPGRS